MTCIWQLLPLFSVVVAGIFIPHNPHFATPLFPVKPTKSLPSMGRLPSDDVTQMSRNDGKTTRPPFADKGGMHKRFVAISQMFPPTLPWTLHLVPFCHPRCLFSITQSNCTPSPSTNWIESNNISIYPSVVATYQAQLDYKVKGKCPGKAS